jgi:hypothetical protein
MSQAASQPVRPVVDLTFSQTRYEASLDVPMTATRCPRVTVSRRAAVSDAEDRRMTSVVGIADPVNRTSHAATNPVLPVDVRTGTQVRPFASQPSGPMTARRVPLAIVVTPLAVSDGFVRSFAATDGVATSGAGVAVVNPGVVVIAR